MTLAEGKIGHDYIIETLDLPDQTEKRLQALGMIEGTEISVLNGAIARYGARLGVPTPFNTVITQVISCIQNNYDKQYLG